MAPRQMKMPEKTETEREEKFSQRKRPEPERFVQVDRQTKGSYPTAETAHAAGFAIKTDFYCFTSPYMTAFSVRARR
jgi:hypothetical protein